MLPFHEREKGSGVFVSSCVPDQQIDWFVLRGGRYAGLEPDDCGVVRSLVFPGLWLDTAALLRGDLAGTLQMLDEGLATAEHAAFLTRLGSAGT